MIQTKKDYRLPFGLETSFVFLFTIFTFSEGFIQFIHHKLSYYITKPLLMIFLMTFFYYKTQGAKTCFAWRMFVGLTFSLMGDIALMFDEDNAYFLAGVGCFAIAYLAYSYAYLRNILDHRYYNSPVNQLTLPIPYAVYGFGVYYILRKNLGDMELPVVSYMFVITTMGILAALRVNHTTDDSYRKNLLGAKLLILSDTLIGLSRFLGIQGAWIDPSIIMAYFFGQLFTVLGSIEHVRVIETPVNDPVLTFSPEEKKIL